METPTDKGTVTGSSPDRYALLDQLAEEFAQRHRRGERPALSEYIGRHPDLAEDIRALFPALIEVERAEGASWDSARAALLEPAPERPARQIGDFLILREIGRGGMGVVYEAEQLSLGRRVALKVLPGEAVHHGPSVARFRREARAAARLHHTNIVPVFEVGQDRNVFYYAMQYIPGLGFDVVIDELRRQRPGSSAPAPGPVGPIPAAAAPSPRPTARATPPALSASRMAWSLATGRFDHPSAEAAGAETAEVACPVTSTDVADSRVALASAPTREVSLSGSGARHNLAGLSTEGARGRAPFYRSVARVGVQVAQGLAYAHDRGIVHRDIKPSNLLLDASGIVWITDFGLAKAGNDDLTASGDIVGTLRYMAPERLRGEGDARADVYALGLTLYELVALRPAYDAPDRLRLIERIKSEEPARPRAIDPHVPRDLETIILKAIEKDPRHRYPSASALADDLGHFLEDRPISARPVSTTERAVRWCRRNPYVAGMLSLIVTLLALGTAASAYAAHGYQRLAEQKGDALRKSEVSARIAKSAARDERVAREEVEKARRVLAAELYASRMNLVQSALSEGNVGRMAALLDGERPRLGQTDFRGFEWHYWRRQIHGEDRAWILPWVKSDTPNLTFSPDGRWAAGLEQRKGSSALTVRELATGRERIRIPADDYPSLSHLTLAFSGDGTRLAFGWTIPEAGQEHLPRNRRTDDAYQLHVWDLVHGREVHKGVERHPNRDVLPYSMWLSRDGGTLVQVDLLKRRMSRERDWLYSLTVRDVSTGRVALRREFPFDFEFPSVALSPDGSRLAFRASGVAVQSNGVIAPNYQKPREILVWDLRAPGTPPRTIKDAGWARRFGLSNAMHFMPDGRRLVETVAVSTSETLLRTFDEEGRVARDEPLPRGLTFLSLAFSPDGELLVLRWQGLLQVRETATGRVVHEERSDLRPRLAMPMDLVFPAGPLRMVGITRLTTGGYLVREWDLSRGRSNAPTARAMYGVSALALSPDGSKAAVEAAPEAGRPPALMVYAAGGGSAAAPPVEVGEPQSSSWLGLAFDPSARRLAVARYSTAAPQPPHVEVWDLATRKRLAALDRGALGGRPGTGNVVDGNLNAALALNRDGTLLAVSVTSGDGGVLGSERFIQVVDVERGKVLRSLRHPSRDLGGRQDGLAFHPDGRHLACGVAVLGPDGKEGQVEIWDAVEGQLTRTLRGVGSNPQRLTFSRDGSRLAGVEDSRRTVVASDPSRVLVWDLDGPAAPVRLDGHVDQVNAVAFSPDGRRLATAGVVQSSHSTEVILWDTATGRELSNWKIERGEPYELAFGDDGRVLHVAVRSRLLNEAQVVTLDGTPLNAEVDSAEIFVHLAQEHPLNSDLEAVIGTQAGLEKEVREGAVRMAAARAEAPAFLAYRAGALLRESANEPNPGSARRALPYAEEAARIAPENAEAQSVLGQALFEAGRAREARAPLLKAAALGPERQQTWEFQHLAYLAMTETRLGRRDDAEVALEMYRTKEVAAYERMLENPSSASTGPPAPNALLRRARGVVTEVFGPEAAEPTPARRLELLDRAVERFPDDPDLRLGRSRLLLNDRRVDQAADDFGYVVDRQVPKPPTRFWLFLNDERFHRMRYRAFALDEEAFLVLARKRPDDETLWIARADALVRRGDWARAAAVMRRLYDLAPDNISYRHVGATVFARAGDAEGFRRTCREMLERFGGSEHPDEAAWVAFAPAAAPGGADDFSGFTDQAAKAMKLDPDRLLTSLVAAAVDYRAGRIQAALDRLRSPALPDDPPLSPQVATRHALLALSLLRLGREDEARRELATAAALTRQALGRADLDALPAFGAWHDWLRVQLLRREAEGLLAEDRFPEDPFES